MVLEGSHEETVVKIERIEPKRIVEFGVIVVNPDSPIVVEEIVTLDKNFKEVEK